MCLLACKGRPSRTLWLPACQAGQAHVRRVRRRRGGAADASAGWAAARASAPGTVASGTTKSNGGRFPKKGRKEPLRCSRI